MSALSLASAPGGGAPFDSEQLARTSFEVTNDVVTLPPEDLILAYDTATQEQVASARPWRTDPHYFARVRLSAVAMIKMVVHAKSGGDLEVMGLMQGKVDPTTRTLYVMDTFALPVEGTETRVNAQAEAYEYMVQYTETSHLVHRQENVVGWYHSHPGYGCWLSGIDVATQEVNQQYNEPWIAIVVDPKRTLSSGKVDIGAFRTLPASPSSAPAGNNSGYTNGGAGAGNRPFIPSEKAGDYGVHAHRYYALPVEIFKTSQDTAVLQRLWHTYWVATLSDSPLVSNATLYMGQVSQLADRLEGIQKALVHQAQEEGEADVETPQRGGAAWGRPALSGAAAAGGPNSTTGWRLHLGDASGGHTAGSGVGTGTGTGTSTNPLSDSKTPITPGAATDPASGQPETATQLPQGSRPLPPGTTEGQTYVLLKALRQHRDQPPLQAISRDADRLAHEAHYGLVAQVLKDHVFNDGRAQMEWPQV